MAAATASASTVSQLPYRLRLDVDKATGECPIGLEGKLRLFALCQDHQLWLDGVVSWDYSQSGICRPPRVVLERLQTLCNDNWPRLIPEHLRLGCRDMGVPEKQHDRRVEVLRMCMDALRHHFWVHTIFTLLRPFYCCDHVRRCMAVNSPLSTSISYNVVPLTPPSRREEVWNMLRILLALSPAVCGQHLEVCLLDWRSVNYPGDDDKYRHLQMDPSVLDSQNYRALMDEQRRVSDACAEIAY